MFYEYNDVESLEAAVREAGSDLAAIFASPIKHDTFVDQELPNPEYARSGSRVLCDEHGALLIVDDVRAGFRLARDCSWSLVNVKPDLSTWGKAIANGHPISALWAPTSPASQPPPSTRPARSGSRPRRWPPRWRH
ncbi:aminotransferase class III-fold pyridoxal phosphate-dependent enzyme [Caulobacter segnis]